MIDEATIQKLLDKIGAIVELKAKMLCPVDMGILRASIKHRIEGDKVIVYTDIDYARDMEYGTPPGKLDENEKEDLKEWAERHNLPAWPVIRKIEREGIKVGSEKAPLKTPSGFRPFMRPALHQSISDIKQLIRNELG
jgi:hypothetical protein